MSNTDIKILCNKSDLVAVADAIRSKNGTTESYKVNQLASAVENISGGASLPTLSNPGSASDLVSGKELIDQNGSIITGTNPYEKSSTDAAIAEEANLISQIQTVLNDKASANIELPTLANPGSPSDLLSGKELIDQDGNKITGTMSVKSAATIIPSTSDQTINSGVYLTGAQTIKGDANLIADNIKSGISIFGITGTASGGGGSGSTETCTFNATISRGSIVLVYLDINNNIVIRDANNPVRNGESIIMAKKPFLAKYVSPLFSGSCSGCDIYSPHMSPDSGEIFKRQYMSNQGNLIIPTSDIITIFVSCFLPDTLISLADGTKKQIKDLTYSDNLLVWNFNEGKLDTAPICWLTKSGLKNDHYYKLTFSDGTILKTTGQNSNHKIYNVDEHFFKGVDKTKIGDKIFSENGVVTVTNKEYIEEEVEYYNLITTKHINCFAEGILTSDRYGNMYQHDENMMNIQDGRTIRPYNEFEAVGIKKYWYNTLCLGEVNGTIDEIKHYIDKLECQMLTPPGYNELK